MRDALLLILLQMPAMGEQDLTLPAMPGASNVVWWQYALYAMILLLGSLFTRYMTVYFEKVSFAGNPAIGNQIRELRKLQKQGMITKEQADNRINKLIDSTAPNPAENAQ